MPFILSASRRGMEGNILNSEVDEGGKETGCLSAITQNHVMTSRCVIFDLAHLTFRRS